MVELMLFLTHIKPEGYTVIARADATSHGTVTITSKDYLQGLPRSGEIKAITCFDDNVHRTLVMPLR